jgi:hypothetical protein
MYDEERMKSIADKICAKRADDETKYADALMEINMAYHKIPAFVRADMLKFRAKGKYNVMMYRDLRGDDWVSALIIGDGRDAAKIDFDMDGVTDYRKLSLAASQEVEEAQCIKPGLE